MALIQCSECGKSISDKAVSCPGCGCPVAEVFKFEEPQYVDCSKYNSEQLWQKAYDIQYKGKKSDIPTAVEIYNYILINHSNTLEAGYAKQQLEIMKSAANGSGSAENSTKVVSVSEENTICKSCKTSYSHESLGCPKCHTINPNYKSASVNTTATKQSPQGSPLFTLITIAIGLLISIIAYRLFAMGHDLSYYGSDIDAMRYDAENAAKLTIKLIKFTSALLGVWVILLIVKLYKKLCA